MDTLGLLAVDQSQEFLDFVDLLRLHTLASVARRGEMVGWMDKSPAGKKMKRNLPFAILFDRGGLDSHYDNLPIAHFASLRWVNCAQMSTVMAS